MAVLCLLKRLIIPKRTTYEFNQLFKNANNLSYLGRAQRTCKSVIRHIRSIFIYFESSLALR